MKLYFIVRSYSEILSVYTNLGAAKHMARHHKDAEDEYHKDDYYIPPVNLIQSQCDIATFDNIKKNNDNGFFVIYRNKIDKNLKIETFDNDADAYSTAREKRKNFLFVSVQQRIVFSRITEKSFM